MTGRTAEFFRMDESAKMADERFDSLRQVLEGSGAADAKENRFLRSVREILGMGPPLLAPAPDPAAAFRFRARRDFEVELAPDRQTIRVLVDGKPMTVRYLVISTRLPPLEERIYRSYLDLQFDVTLWNGEMFVLHTWVPVAEGTPPLRPDNLPVQLAEAAWETPFTLEEHLEAAEIQGLRTDDWVPVRVYKLDEED